MKLFVTGATGFIGTHFLKQALGAGHEIVAQRRIGSRTRLPLVKEPLWVEGSLDKDWTEELKGCDVLVHLAAHTPAPPYSTLDECLYWNVYVPIKLAQNAAAAGIKRYLIAGSCFEYGQTSQDIEFIEVDSRLAPTLSYPTSKAAASLAFEGFAREHGHYVKILRIFQVYGEGEHETRFWPSLRRAALAGEDFPMTNGAQVRDFISVEEVASVFLSHLNFSCSKKGVPEVHHVGTGRSQTLLEFATYWWIKWAATGRLRPGKVAYRKNEFLRIVPRVCVNEPVNKAFKIGKEN
jgi:nucleoside-diphosphate-sugar epimerase